MLRNYFLIALRHMWRQRGYASINVFGLSVALACCLLIALFVIDELSFDSFHERGDRIYRVVSDFTAPSTPTDHLAVTSRPIAAALLDRYPEVEAAARLIPYNPTVRLRGQYHFDDQVYFADADLFELFTFPLLEGQSATALREPHTAVITESTAARYFPGRSPIGRTLTLNDTVRLDVTGIAADVPPNSHLQFDILVSAATYEALLPLPAQPDWTAMQLYTYVLLRPGTDAAAFQDKIRGLVMEEFGEVLAPFGLQTHLALEALPEIYLGSERLGQAGPVGDRLTVFGFVVIALFVLLIACVNYMNLATARSMQRAREVGVRKALGAQRSFLVRQFLVESVLVVAIGMVLAVGLVSVVLPNFGLLTGKELALASLVSLPFLLAITSATAGLGVLAGSYPALVLSRFGPAHVLKGDWKASPHGSRMRQGLVVVQFAVSVALIAGTVVVIQQLAYMRAQSLGFDREHLLVIDSQGIPNAEMAQRFETAKEAMLRHPGVLAATASNSTPGAGLPLLLTVVEGLEEGDSRRMHYLLADHDFTHTYGLEVVAGRPLSRAYESDAREAALINESAAAALGWGSPEEGLGRRLGVGSQDRTIVGVFRDYHHFSLRSAVEPMVMMVVPPAFDAFTLRLDGRQLAATIGHLGSTWEELFPGYAFSYAFVDDAFNAQYLAEERLGRLIGGFAALAVLIACLGLFGLAAFTAQQRRREIGVRKVLGATVPGLIALLSKDFLRLVGIAFVLSIPLAWWVMSRWLEGFAYRVEIGPALFLTAGTIALAIALVTVAGQALRAATMDPVKAIRAE